MEDYDPLSSWDADAAERYVNHLRGDEDDAVAFLSKMAGQGKVLELAIGTGRIAIPLKEKGVHVDGIEGSADMVAKLHAHPAGESIEVVVGNMATASMNSKYKLVYLVYNTIFNLLTADSQIRCFENAARHLTQDGRFVVETAVPHAWIENGKSDYVKAEYIGVKEVVLDVARYDPATQIFEENHVTLTENGNRMNPIVCRLITPGEMDLMARIAGLQLIERLGNWRGSVFDVNSIAHVSVYGHQ